MGLQLLDKGNILILNLTDSEYETLSVPMRG